MTDDQLSVLGALTRVGIAPYADFGVWKPFGQRAAKNLKFTSHFLDHTGAWRCKEIPGPDCFSTWEACWRVFRTAAIMCDVATPAVLDRYAARFRERMDRFSDSWHLCVLSTVKRNSTNPIQKFRHLCPVARGTASSRPRRNDRDFWKEELEDKVADFRNVRQMVNRFGSKDRSRSRRRGDAKQDRGRSGAAHPHRRADGRYSTTATGSQICFSWNRVQDGCGVSCSSIERMCVNFVLDHTGPSSAHKIQVGRPQPKVLGRARERTRASSECV